MKKVLSLSLMILLVFAVFASDKFTSSYKTWFEESFLPAYDDALPYITDDEIRDLYRILDLKPATQESGNYYDIYIRKFDEYLRDFYPSLNENEQEALKILMKAAPSRKNAQRHYKLFIKIFDNWLEEALPTLNDDERKILTSLIKIAPITQREEDYNVWLKLYNKYYDEFGPTIDTDEEEVLDLILKLKPEVEDDYTTGDDEYYSVKRSDLLKIRALIRRGKKDEAIDIINDILSDY